MVEYIKALENCSVENGVLRVPSINKENLGTMQKFLRESLINYEIPHWKVIGISVTLANSRVIPDFITKPKGIDKSYAEILTPLQQVVLKEGGGNPISAGLHEFKWSHSKHGETGFIISQGKHVKSNSDSLIYCGESGKTIQTLKSDVDIMKFDSASSTAEMLILKSTGIKNLNITAKIISDFGHAISKLNENTSKGVYTRFVPISQVYDLSKFVNIGIYNNSDNFIKLNYKCEINEKILESILRNWANETK